MIKLPKEVIVLMNKFKENKFQIYVVGGAVRDALLGQAKLITGISQPMQRRNKSKNYSLMPFIIIFMEQFSIPTR